MPTREPINRKVPGLPKYSGPGHTYADSKRYRDFLVAAGKLMRDVRMSVGDTQMEFETKTGGSHGALSRMELGRSPGVQLWSLWRLADLYGYDLKITVVKRRSHTKKEKSDEQDDGTVVTGRFPRRA